MLKKKRTLKRFFFIGKTCIYGYFGIFLFPNIIKEITIAFDYEMVFSSGNGFCLDTTSLLC